MCAELREEASMCVSKAKGQWLAICLVLVVASCGLAACNRGRTVEAARENIPPSVSPEEQHFMTQAAQANLSEIDMARIVMQKSDNTEVRDYAHMMRSDHTSALQDLTDLMIDKNVPAPKTIAADTQRDISRMNNLTGPEFDREYVNMMVSDHQKTVELFRDMQANAQNPDVKKYVEKALPTIEMHLDKAQQLQSKLFSKPAR
jgi:putative membrane protein